MKKALLLALFLLPLASPAQSVPASSSTAVSYPITTLRNISTLGPITVSPANVPRFALAHTLGGVVESTSAARVPLAGGKYLPVTVVSAIPKATVAGALGRFAAKSLPLLGTGVALYDLGQELGFGMSNAGGGLEITQPPTIASYAAPDPFTLAGSGHLNSCASHYDPNAANAVCFQKVDDTRGRLLIRHSGRYPPPLAPGWMRQGTDAGWAWNDTSPTVPLTTRTTETGDPISLEAFTDAVAARSGWPTSSALARATKDAIESGESLAASPQTVTGPATTPGPVTTTTNTTNNTTTTSTTTNNHTYSGATVTTTTTTTNVTVDNSTGAVTNSTTIVNQADQPEQQPEEDAAAQDTPLPEQPVLYEREYPDGLEGIWNTRKAELENTSLFTVLPTLLPDLGDSRACPSWQIPSFYGGTLDASIPCYVWSFLRLVIIISALLLARRLIFGG